LFFSAEDADDDNDGTSDDHDGDDDGDGVPDDEDEDRDTDKDGTPDIGENLVFKGLGAHYRGPAKLLGRCPSQVMCR
jgi:hypothetical protein